MNWTEPTTDEQAHAAKKRLRKFGIIMWVGLTVVGTIFYWTGRPWGVWVGAVGGGFLLTGLIFPVALRPVETLWLLFGEVMSWVMTRVILTATFFVVITPIGWVVRLTGKDSFGRRPDRSRDTYWVPVEHDGPGSRPDKPY